MKKLFLFSILIITIIFFSSCKKSNDEWVSVKVFPEYDWMGISVVGNHQVFVFGAKTTSDNREPQYLLSESSNAGISWNKVYDKADIWSKGGWKYIHFVNEDKGYITGYRTLFLTKNSGHDWDTNYLGMNDFSKIYQVDERLLFGYGLGGFFESIDTGSTWTSNGLYNNIKAIDFINNSVGFMGGIQGIFKTEDGGQGWQKVSDHGLNFIQLDFYDENNAAALISEYENIESLPKFYFSTTNDGGFSWNKMDLSTFNININDYSCLIFENTSKIYIGAGNGIFSSTDFGHSWSKECDGEQITGIKKIGNHLIAVGLNGLIIRN